MASSHQAEVAILILLLEVVHLTSKFLPHILNCLQIYQYEDSVSSGGVLKEAYAKVFLLVSHIDVQSNTFLHTLVKRQIFTKVLNKSFYTKMPRFYLARTNYFFGELSQI